MAGLILCRSKYASKPYYISNMAIHIRSMEELCYYIYHNIYLIGADLFDEGLIGYIEQELEEPELAKQLSFLINENAGFSELVITVLHYVDFYSDKEIEELRELIHQLDLQNASERVKSRADNFLENHRYNSAIRNYEMIVYGRRDRSLSMNFYGNVWHNMGVCYARMFCYKDAAVCFRTAYEMNNNESSNQMAITSQVLEHRNEHLEEDDELSFMIAREVETMLSHATEESEYNEVRNILSLREEGKVLEYRKAVNDLISKWKMEYTNYMK